MNKLIASIIVILAFVIGPSALAGEFLSLDQKIKVGTDSVLTIQEIVKIDFSSSRHGIFRDLPVKYRTQNGNPFSLRVKVISVSDLDGKVLTYKTSRSGDYINIKIGDADKTVTGPQNYVITYTVSRALLYLNTHDELYWNTTAEPWGDLGLPEQTITTVVLPNNIESTQTRCFTEVGSVEDGGCDVSKSAGVVQFSTFDKPLTIVVGWTKGNTVEPSALAKFNEWLRDNWIVFWPFIAFGWLYYLWHKKGRDPKSGPLVVSYSPPDGVMPAELGALIKGSANKNEISATIVDLAVKGYLNIVEKETVSIFAGGKGYAFELKNSDYSKLTGFENAIMVGLFGLGKTGTIIDLTSLQNTFHSAAQSAEKLIVQSIVGRGWFLKNPVTVRGTYMAIGFAYIFLLMFLGSGVVGNSALWIISTILPGIFVMGFGYFMPVRSAVGATAYAHAMGFKEFISKAEKYRLEWNEKENIFEKYLPYAMVFGVVNKWAKAFEGMQLEPPSWYSGKTLNSWSPLVFAHTLNSATSTISRSIMTPPSAKGGSGGGFGGGGFGGGGFGGGRGGSW